MAHYLFQEGHTEAITVTPTFHSR